jgi:plasmid stabilization system protein ParE
MGAARVRLRQGVRLTLATIRRYTEREHGHEQAQKYLAGFRETFDRLADYPRSSPSVEPGSDLRIALYGLHRIFYRELPDGIAIELIIHQRQDFPREIEGLRSGPSPSDEPTTT